jgi:predicted CopG family antitoxin
MSRKTITVSEAAYERLQAHKDSGESWTEVINRAAEAMDSEDEHKPNAVAVTNIDEIARATADEVENRMTRR